MSISSETLFHFTKYQNLIGIISSKCYYPRYCKEHSPWGGGVKKVFIPMVCFCDIPLSQTKDHKDFYGHYGIGMAGEWGRRKGLNPVLYLRENSELWSHFKDSVNRLAPGTEIFDDRDFLIEIYKRQDAVAQKFSQTLEGITQSLRAKMSILNYIKVLEGHTLKDGETIPRVRKYYDEREWRYSPPIMLLSEEALPDLEQKNRDLEGYKLSFEYDDIKYIIIKNENQSDKFLKALKKRGLSPKELDLLKAKLLNSEQIQKDF